MNTAHADLPTFFTVGSLASLSKKDAEQYVRGLIVRHCPSPEFAKFHLAKFGNGWAYEIQENGTGRSLLPAIIRKLQSGADTICVATASRSVLVQLNDDQLECSMLAQSLSRSEKSPSPDNNSLEFGPKLTSCEPDHGRLLVAAVAVSCAATAALTAGFVVNMVTPRISGEKQSTYMTHAEDLPISHWPGQVLGNEFVYAVRFDGKKWLTERRRVTVSTVEPPVENP